jgi:hypothetical protein
LQSCVSTIEQSIFQLGLPQGNSKISPEFILSLLEKSQQNCADFTSSFIEYLKGGDPKNPISTSTILAQSVSTLIQNGHFIDGYFNGEETEDFFKNFGEAFKKFFSQVQSNILSRISESKRSNHVFDLSKNVQKDIGFLVSKLERLVKNSEKIDGDLSEAVATKINEAAKSIEEASNKLQSLIAEQTTVNVNSAILQSAMAITTAITHLIKCARASQEEIVKNNQGNSTVTAFYKKNNKWTEGLISAAQSVSSATV